MLIKLRFRFPDVLFGVLLAVAIFAMGAVFWSSPNSSTPTQTQTDTKSGERNPGKQEIAWWQDPVAVFTLGLVFIGLVQAGIFYGQMRLIRRSLAPAEQAARAAQAAAEHIPTIERAYMFGGPHEIGLEGGKEGVAFVTFQVINAGKTPGFLKSVSFEMSETAPGDTPPVYTPIRRNPHDYIVSAGQGFSVKTFYSDFTGPQFAWGFIEYEDIFRLKVHTSRFCIQIFPEIAKSIAAGSPAWNDWD
jgi:hypothetical protein